MNEAPHDQRVYRKLRAISDREASILRLLASQGRVTKFDAFLRNFYPELLDLIQHGVVTQVGDSVELTDDGMWLSRRL